ncbi:hypothetical protein ACIP6P_00315 [Streptomyces sp. NPDC088729]|uniref:hypothetical protein n=1 Tax=Streptomyces sp. NPDC088729 TaxID=3365876 RepID=UPI00381F0601
MSAGAVGAGGTGVRVGRYAVWAALPAELVLVAVGTAGVRMPGAVLVGAQVVVVALLAVEVSVLGRLYAARRRAGTERGEAWRETVSALVPVAVGRLVVNELRTLHSLGLWLLRRRHRIPEGASPVAYTGPQTGTVYVLLFVCAVETAVLALVIPWPPVDAVLLAVDVYGMVLVLAHHAGCVTRPHVVGADGSLRVRYGALFDLRVPASAVASARVEQRFPDGGMMRLGDDGTLDLAVGGRTTVTVELTGPVEFTRPLGKRGTARTLRFHADDPRAVVAALSGKETGPAPGADRSR